MFVYITPKIEIEKKKIPKGITLKYMAIRVKHFLVVHFYDRIKLIFHLDRFFSSRTFPIIYFS